jgi:hypothetical protein
MHNTPSGFTPEEWAETQRQFQEMPWPQRVRFFLLGLVCLPWFILKTLLGGKRAKQG